MKAFNRSLEINPDFAYGYYGLSLVYAQQGEIWKQSDAISRALEIEERLSGSDNQDQATPADIPQSTPLSAITGILGILCAGLWIESKKR